MAIDSGIVAIFITIILSTVATSFGYGILTNKVSGHTSDIKEMKSEDKIIGKNLDDLRMLVQRIESKLDK